MISGGGDNQSRHELGDCRPQGVEMRDHPIGAELDDRAISKPDPRALLLTIAKAGGEAARAVMVGDSATDIATAKAAGVPVVAVDFGYADIPVAELGPDRVISHFDALWPAVAELMPAAAKRSAQVYAASSRAPHLPSS